MCKHAVFRYNERRTKQTCKFCGAERRIWIRKDNTATVGEWKEKEDEKRTAA